jgi:hypothetical protein
VTPLIGRVGLASRAPETTSVVYRCVPQSRHLGEPAERSREGAAQSVDGTRKTVHRPGFRQQ